MSHKQLEFGDTLVSRNEPSSAASTPLPTQIGRFRIEGKIGAGGMGMVLRGHDDDLDRSVAIKLLLEGPRNSEVSTRARARMQREARAMARLSHPNVVTIHEVGVHDDQLFIAMEFIDGLTLREWLETPRSQAEILAVFCAAGRGLEAAHAADIIHRDFKPENVLIGNDGRVRVLDFGLAGEHGQLDDEARTHTHPSTLDDTKLTQTGAMMGTPAYMAPEQFEGGNTDTRTDQFAFCVALHEALYGVRPFAGQGLLALARAVERGELVDEPESAELPRRLRHALVRGLATEPARRHPSMSSLLALLEASEQPASPSLLARAGLVLGGLALLGLLALAFRSTPPSPPDPAPPGSPPIDSSLPIDSSPPTFEPLFADALTHTTGYGVYSMMVDPTGEQLIYSDDDGTWLRRLEGGVPEALIFDGQPAPYAVFGIEAGTKFSTWKGELVRSDPDGKLVSLGQLQGKTSLALAPDGELMLSIGPIISEWDLRQSPPTRRVLDPHPQVNSWSAIDWAPDAQHYAFMRLDEKHVSLVVHDRSSERVASQELDSASFMGLAWTAPHALVTLEKHDELAFLRCVHLRENTIEFGAKTRILGFEERRFTKVVGSAGKDAILLESGTGSRIAGVIPLEEDAALRLTSPDLNHEDHSPAWLSDEELAFVSERFMKPVILRAPVADLEHATVLNDAETQTLRSDGKGGLLAYQLVQEAPLLRHFPAPDFEPVALLDDAELLARLPAVSCSRGETCLLSGASGYRTLDLSSAKLGPPHACPARSCENLELSPTGTHMLLVDFASGHTEIYPLGDTRPSWILVPHPESRLMIQAGLWTTDGKGLYLTGLRASATDQDPYALAYVEVLPGAQARELWSNPNVWLHGSALSPSGKALATSGRSLHLEAYRAELRGFCQD